MNVFCREIPASLNVTGTWMTGPRAAPCHIAHKCMKGFVSVSDQRRAMLDSANRLSALLVHHLQHQVLTTAAVPECSVSSSCSRKTLANNYEGVVESNEPQHLVPMRCEHSNRRVVSTVCSHRVPLLKHRRSRRRRRSRITRRTRSSCHYSSQPITLHPGGIRSNILPSSS
jgi:hypothetical protein